MKIRTLSYRNKKSFAPRSTDVGLSSVPGRNFDEINTAVRASRKFFHSTKFLLSLYTPLTRVEIKQKRLNNYVAKLKNPSKIRLR